MALDAWFPSGSMAADVNARENQFSLTRAASINRLCGEKQIPVSSYKVRIMKQCVLIIMAWMAAAQCSHAQYTFGPEVQSTNIASMTYDSGTGVFQYSDTALFSENHAALPLMGTAAAFITTTNGWTTSVTVNIAARSMTVTAGTSCDVVMGLLLEFTNSIDLVGILLAQDNNTGGGDDSIYPEGWYGTAVRFVALTNRNASVVLTPLGNSLPSRDGSVYLPLTGGTNTSAGTESMSRATGVLTLSYSASTSILTGYYDGTAVSSYCLAGWGLNPPLTLSVFGNSEVESVVVSEGTVTGSNFYAGLLPVLSVNATGANLVLSWLTNAAGFTLQSATNLVSAVWSTNLPSPLVVGGQNIVTNPITGSQNFFRLISN